MSRTMKKLLTILLTCAILVIAAGCGEKKGDRSGPEGSNSKSGSVKKGATFGASGSHPDEIDQVQEVLKDQHDTSFSHEKNRNWSSFTAGMKGFLTRVELYGKPHTPMTTLYGDEMIGTVRLGSPTGKKLGIWKLSRDDILAQFKSRGLSKGESGWIELRMKGEIPQNPGETYYLVCEKISEGKKWFGAFAFSEDDPYPGGRHWHRPQFDLVFRTYVGQSVRPEDALAGEELNATLIRHVQSLKPKPPEPVVIKPPPVPPPPQPVALSVTGAASKTEGVSPTGAASVTGGEIIRQPGLVPGKPQPGQTPAPGPPEPRPPE